MPKREALEGRTINNLYVERYVGSNYYICKCLICGNERMCRAYELKLGKYRACKSCEEKEHKNSSKYSELVGKTVGHWIINEYIGNKKYRCTCDICKRQFEVFAENIKNGTSKACVDCANMLRTSDMTQKKFSSGSVVKYAGGSTWECTCGICGATLYRSTSSLKNTDKILCKHCSPSRLRKDIDTTGTSWEVIEYIGGDRLSYKCRCKLCGKVSSVPGYNLRSGHSKSCGCNQLTDLSDKQFNEWIVLDYAGNGYWNCKCSCGNIRKVHGYELRSGQAKSCGCKKWEYSRSTMLKRYSEVAPSKFVDTRTENQITALESSDNLKKWIDSNFKAKPTTYELSESLGLGISNTLKNIHRFGLESLVDIDSRHSKMELQTIEFLKSIGINDSGIITGDRKILNGKELDVYIPEKKVAIEFNGTYWHSTVFKDSEYHQRKTLACMEKGIRLIHIFEYEWEDLELQNKIKLYLKDMLTDEKVRIGARETKVSEIDNREAEAFLSDYHLQGYTAASVSLGCRYNDELVGVMAFGNPHFNHNYEWEIIRMCWKPGYSVVGGTNKMFRNFVDKYNPASIITYSDLSKFTGKVYETIGFKPIQPEPFTKPSYVWVNTHENIYLTRYQTQKKKLVELGLGTEQDTENDIMQDNGFLKVYGAGNIRLEWINNTVNK